MSKTHMLQALQLVSSKSSIMNPFKYPVKAVEGKHVDEPTRSWGDISNKDFYVIQPPTREELKRQADFMVDCFKASLKVEPEGETVRDGDEVTLKDYLELLREINKGW